MVSLNMNTHYVCAYIHSYAFIITAYTCHVYIYFFNYTLIIIYYINNYKIMIVLVKTWLGMYL